MTETAQVPFELHVSLDAMLIGDLELLENPVGRTKEWLDLLQRLVVSPDVRTMPVSMLPAIGRAIAAKVATLSNSKN